MQKHCGEPKIPPWPDSDFRSKVILSQNGVKIIIYIDIYPLWIFHTALNRATNPISTGNIFDWLPPKDWFHGCISSIPDGFKRLQNNMHLKNICICIVHICHVCIYHIFFGGGVPWLHMHTALLHTYIWMILFNIFHQPQMSWKKVVLVDLWLNYLLVDLVTWRHYNSPYLCVYIYI